ncbi:MAG: hypothetical protein QW303_03480 [Nitrososphaerota archaeon]
MSISVDDGIKTIRTLESKIASLRMQLSLESIKRRQAEEELRKLEAIFQTINDTKGYFCDSPIPTSTKSLFKKSATAILCLNDWHVEGCVRHDVVDNANEFNLEIASSRIETTFQKALNLLRFVRNLVKIDQLIIWLGGDLINGNIHQELEEANFLGPTEAIIFIQNQISKGIDFFLKRGNLKEILVVTNYGNHGRSCQLKRIATAYRHSWEWLAYTNLAFHYRKHPRVKFKIEKGYHNWVNVQGHDIRFHHGDSINFCGGVGGVVIPLRKKIMQWNKRRKAYLDILGHFHQFSDCWDFVLCGCLIGYDAYAINIGAEYQPPTQTFIVIEKKRGKILSLPIFLE